jgi:hypothetical protein
MTKMFKAAALALATIPAVALAAPAYAQSGVAVANLEGAIEQTNAYRTAMTQMQTTYKAQIDQARTRSTPPSASPIPTGRRCRRSTTRCSSAARPPIRKSSASPRR